MDKNLISYEISFCSDRLPVFSFFLFQWKKKTEKHRAAIKFKAAARIARVTHDLSASVRLTDDISETTEETDENVE